MLVVLLLNLMHLELSAITRHFCTISTDFPKKRLKLILIGRSFLSSFLVS